MSDHTLGDTGEKQPREAGLTDLSGRSAWETVASSPVIQWMLNAIGCAVSAGAMAQLMAGTACWCVAGNGPPPDLLIAGIGSAVLAVTVVVLLADRKVVVRWLKPLLWAFVGEYALAFGTLGLGFVSTATYQFTVPLHYPSLWLAQLLPNPGRDTIGRDIAFAVVTQWVLIASVIYLVRWYVHRRYTRNDCT